MTQYQEFQARLKLLFSKNPLIVFTVIIFLFFVVVIIVVLNLNIMWSALVWFVQKSWAKKFEIIGAISGIATFLLFLWTIKDSNQRHNLEKIKFEQETRPYWYAEATVCNTKGCYKLHVFKITNVGKGMSENLKVYQQMLNGRNLILEKSGTYPNNASFKINLINANESLTSSENLKIILEYTDLFNINMCKI